MCSVWYDGDYGDLFNQNSKPKLLNYIMNKLNCFMLEYSIRETYILNIYKERIKDITKREMYF